jgi:hypothetical protein
MKIKQNLAAMALTGVLSLLVGQSAMSTPFPLTRTFAEHNETQAYVGLQWFTGETNLTKPNMAFGLRQTKTDVSNKVTGYDISYTYSLEKSQSDAVRLGYLDGNCNSGLTTAGLGYSLKKDAVLGFAGFVTSYAKAFGEIDGNKNLGAGFEVNTLGCAGDRESTTTTPLVN